MLIFWLFKMHLAVCYCSCWIFLFLSAIIASIFSLVSRHLPPTITMEHLYDLKLCWWSVGKLSFNSWGDFRFYSFLLTIIAAVQYWHGERGRRRVRITKCFESVDNSFAERWGGGSYVTPHGQSSKICWRELILPASRAVNLYLFKEEMRTSVQRSGQWPTSTMASTRLLLCL